METETVRDLAKFFKVDKELIIIFLLVAITGIIFFYVVNQRAFLNFFYLPVVLGAYFYGKRYATLAALLSIILVFVVAYTYPATFSFNAENNLHRWLDLVTWGGFLLITGYTMGMLYERKEKLTKEIHKTYLGVIEMLSQVIDSVDKETQNHSYRVSIFSEKIAQAMNCPLHEIENIRIAALLHDIGKIGVTSEVLSKVGKLTSEEFSKVQHHPRHGANVLEPIGGRVLELLPFILQHHERYDGTGYHGLKGEDIPLGARIIAVADVYDALISDRAYRKAMTPTQAQNEITTNAGSHFCPEVVKTFVAILPKLDSDSPLFSVAPTLRV
jgi:HD-GYP domain-containing protein (c-di-GMP phosphodiesterase class II)